VFFLTGREKAGAVQSAYSEIPRVLESWDLMDSFMQLRASLHAFEFYSLVFSRLGGCRFRKVIA